MLQDLPNLEKFDLKCFNSGLHFHNLFNVYMCGNVNLFGHCQVEAEPYENLCCGFLLFKSIKLDPQSYETILKRFKSIRLFSSISENEGD